MRRCFDPPLPGQAQINPAMRVEAYTLIEILLVMALTGLVLLIAWGAYSSFHLMGREYEKRNFDQADWRSLDLALQLDARAADSVRLQGDQLVFAGRATYQRLSQTMVRTTSVGSDSFSVLVDSLGIQAWPQGQEVCLQLGSGQSICYPVQTRASARKTIPNNP